jgi:outer membrane usher protein
VTYDLANIEGGDGIKRSFRLAGEYRSEKFAAINTLNPRNNTMLTVSTSYSQELPWDLSGSLSASYSVIRDEEDHYGADLNLARSFGPAVSASLSLGYDHSATPTTSSRLPEGVKAMMRLNYRVSENSSLDGSHDVRDGRSQISYRHQEGNGVGSWNAQVEVEHEGGSVDGDDNIGLNGSLGYIGNRAEVAVSQHTGFVGFDGNTTSQRTSVTAGTAIAFADGTWAVGRPVTNSFAIVEPHANLPDSTVTVGSSKDSARASSDFLGPALLPDISPYSPSRVPIDVDNLPMGYDLGTGGFDLLAPYKSGYRFTVGSDYTVTAFGTLTDAEGEPIPLLTGIAFEEGHPDDHQVTIFTNKTGRFGAQGLRPGRWVIEMATEPKTRFVFEVPKDTVGLLRLNTLTPVKDGT